MNHHSDEGPDDEEPVLRTPHGAAPRALPTDRFDSFGVQSKAAFSPSGERSEKVAEPLARELGPARPLEWEFAMPGTRALEPGNPALIKPDVNQRNTPGPLKEIREDIVPIEGKEKFNDNWQRMAAQPRKKRRVERKRSRPWYRAPDGKLNLSVLIKPALVVVLGAVIIMVAIKVLEPVLEPPPVPLPPAPAGN